MSRVGSLDDGHGVFPLLPFFSVCPLDSLAVPDETCGTKPIVLIVIKLLKTYYSLFPLQATTPVIRLVDGSFRLLVLRLASFDFDGFHSMDGGKKQVCLQHETLNARTAFPGRLPHAELGVPGILPCR